MILSRTLPATLVLATAVFGAAGLSAQSRRPDYSGTWQEDRDRSKALTELKGHVWRVASAGAARTGGTSQPGDAVRGPLTILTQSATEIVIERRFDDEIIDRTVLKLDGSVSINASRNGSSRSTTVWKGNALVTTGTSHFEFSDMRATSATGEPIREITRDFVTTRTLMPDGTMQIESRSTQDGEERVTWSVLVRVKS
jgi:hypothetical protein